MTPYIKRSGLDVLPQPITAPNSQVYGFFVKGNLDRIAETLAPLNKVANGKTKYIPLTPYVLIAVVDLPQIRSVNKPYSDLGTICETDFAVWVLAAAGKQHGEVFIAERLVWYVPYIFVNNSFAMNSGREIFGFPKQWGWYEGVPQNHADLQTIRVDATVIPKYGYEAMATRQELAVISQQEATTGVGKPWADFKEGVKEIQQVILGGQPIVIPGIRFLVNAFEDLLNMQAPIAFLKEFRDIENGEMAAYQVVAEAPMKVKFHQVSRLDHRFQIKINPYESHPIAADLGLEGENSIYEPIISFWCELDMSFENGKIIANPQAPSGCLGILLNLFK